jgi:CheY-like chemotaxis protein
MAKKQKILLLDDDQEFLELYREMFSRHLPSLPDVKVAASGPKALSMLETESFDLMSVDLNLPRMDGLQVISIARRKFPQVRMLVLTGIRDEQFRNRAYALGVDQYWVKPESDQEIALLMEAVESLLSQEAEGGFRGVQSKSLVDIIQLECLSQNSCLVRITNGRQEAKIWIDKGDVIDSELQDLAAEQAFLKILTWRTGTFEILPPDANRERTIFTSYQGLLLNTAQAMDEAASLFIPAESADGSGPSEPISQNAPVLVELAQIPGVEFILSQDREQKEARNYFGLEDPEPVAQWTLDSWTALQDLGDSLQVGQLTEVVGTGGDQKVALVNTGSTDLCIGMTPTLSQEHTRDIIKSILAKWVS